MRTREYTVTGRDPGTGRGIAVTVHDGMIGAIEPVELPDDAGWLTAGLVDLQVNGFGGHDLNAADVTTGTVIALTRALRAQGVTTYVPTIITASHERIAHALAEIAAARRLDPEVRHAVPYVHLEGPYISAEDGPRGAHAAEHVRPPSEQEFKAWQAAYGDLIGMVTLSPHYPEAPDFTAWLTGQGVHVAIGHTHARPDEITTVVDAGACLCTHLGNGAHAVLARHPNYLWTQLADDRLTAGFIADGHHLPDDTLRAMIRAKGLDRSLLVSDAVSLAGMPPGRYETPVGGGVDLTSDGRLSLAGSDLLAGAARGLTDGVAQAVKAARLSLAEAIRLATVQPGRFVGGRGTLQVGGPADLVRFAWAPGDASLSISSDQGSVEPAHLRPEG
ncbi:N-acetylglucosamine-6-phosphate deacetylase [Kribbella deserti]|uniref:N-acetylglucosamine-6-phosphate deacetylase n=1 Tax=Kribbella deserti TaxID=1926257 RepID=A0ABV6QM21_9ACTN